MSRYRRSLAMGASFFFTVNAYRRRPVLTHPDVRAALRAAMADVRHALPFRIDAWVLLPWAGDARTRLALFDVPPVCEARVSPD
jgi:hypothetical protein